MKKARIIAISIGIGAIITAAIAVPVGIILSNNSQKNSSSIEKIEITTDLQDDFVNIFSSLISGETGNVQIAINEKSNNWINWINPINQANQIDLLAIEKIDSVTFIEIGDNPETNKVGLEFKITWKSEIKISDDLKNGYNFTFGMTQANQYLPWKENAIAATAKLQTIVNVGSTNGFYASVDKIVEELNDPKNQKAIIDLVDSSAPNNEIRKANVQTTIMSMDVQTGEVTIAVFIVYAMQDLTRIATILDDEEQTPIILNAKISLPKYQNK